MSQRNKKQRLNQILSLSGLTSRRKADTLIKSGRVKVNNRIITQLGTRADWSSDLIEVDEKEIPKSSERLYLILNKPFGYICTLNDPEGRPVIPDLLRDIPQRVYPVGRLDFDTLGLLLVTNDGEWTYRLTHPKYHIPRTYKATVAGRITDKAVEKLIKGVQLEDGPSGRSKVTIISRNETQSTVRMTIIQGKYRQVRRMLEAVEYKVIHLMRTGFGKLVLGNLKVGEYRHLETVEVESMKKLVGMI